jgi:integrase
MKTVQQVIDAYLLHLRVRVDGGDLSEGRMVHAERHLRAFGKLFGSKPLTGCKRHDLTVFLASWPRLKSGWSKQGAVASVICCFRWAEDEGLIDHAPYRKPRSMRFACRPRQPMNLADYAKIMRAAMYRPYRGNRADQPSYSHRFLPKRASCRALRRGLFFLRRTGSRTCEMREARWKDVDWSAGVIRLSHHKTAAVVGEDRVIGLDVCVLRLLRNMRRQEERAAALRGLSFLDQRIFLNGRGKPWTRDTFGKLFRKYAKKAGVAGVSPYSLRHTFAVTGIQNGIGERQIADQMGHTSTKFVAWYGRQSRQKSAYLCGVAADVLRRSRGEKGGAA